MMISPDAAQETARVFSRCFNEKSDVRDQGHSRLARNGTRREELRFGRLCEFGYLKSTSVFARQVLVGFLLLKAFGLGVKFQRLPDAIRGIRKVAVNTRVVRVQGGDGHILFFAGANG